MICHYTPLKKVLFLSEHFYCHTVESIMLYFPLGLIVCCQTGQRRWLCREIKLNDGIFLSSLRADLYLYFQLRSAQFGTLQFCPEHMFLRLAGFHLKSCETLTRAGPSRSSHFYSGHADILELSDPWQPSRNAVANLRSLKLRVSYNLHYRNQVVPFPSL